MKKFLTFAALAAFAASAQAATITWGFGGDVYLVKASSTDYVGDAIAASDATAPEVKTGSYLALVYVGQDVTSFNIGDVSVANVTAAGDPATADYAIDSSYFSDYDPYQLSSITVEGAYTTGASFGVVWYDAGRKKFDYVYSMDDGSALNQTTIITWSGTNSAQAQGDIYACNGTTSYAGVLAVPEPSTAMLAIAGLAMLLKRRRA